MHNGERRPSPREPGRARDSATLIQIYFVIVLSKTGRLLAYSFLKFLVQRLSNKLVKPPGSCCASLLPPVPPGAPLCRPMATQPCQEL